MTRRTPAAGPPDTAPRPDSALPRGAGTRRDALRPTVSTTEAADLLDCSRQNVQDLYKRGQVVGPDRKPGTPVRLYLDTVKDYKARRRPAHPPADRTPPDGPIANDTSTFSAHSIPDGSDGSESDRLARRLDVLEDLVARLFEAETARAASLSNLLAAQAEIVAVDEQTLATRQAALNAEQARLDEDVARARRDRTLRTLLTETLDSHNPTAELLRHVVETLKATGPSETPRPAPRPTHPDGR